MADGPACHGTLTGVRCQMNATAVPREAAPLRVGAEGDALGRRARLPEQRAQNGRRDGRGQEQPQTTSERRPEDEQDKRPDEENCSSIANDEL